MLNSLSPVSGRILCTATAEVLSGSQVKTTPPIVNSQLVFHTPILFDMKFLFLTHRKPLKCKKMLVFYCFFTPASIGIWRNKNGLQWRHSSSGCGKWLASYAGGRNNTPSSFMLQKSPVNLQMRGLYDIPLAGARGVVTLRQRASIP